MNNKKPSFDVRLEEIFGKRSSGTPVFFPEELGYCCPICGLGKKFSDGRFTWSEYNCCIYCPECNIDIPSVLCIKFVEPKLDKGISLKGKDLIEKQKEILYKSVLTALAYHQRKNNG